MSQPWYTTLFQESYLELHSPQDHNTRHEVALLAGLINADEPVLDLCCGYGRISLPLAEMGFEVTGLDLSHDLLAIGKRRSPVSGNPPCWQQGDMRRLPFEDGVFGSVVNMYTSFGYFETLEENLEVLREVRRVLRPGGVFVMQFFNRDNVVRGYSPHVVRRRSDGSLIVIDHVIDSLAGRSMVDYLIVRPDGRRDGYHHSVRMYSAPELVDLMHRAGMAGVQVHGGLDQSEFTFDSDCVVITASKA